MMVFPGPMRPDELPAAPTGAEAYVMDVDQTYVRVDGEWVLKQPAADLRTEDQT